MGSGKSSVGNALSKTLGQQFIDLDHAIEQVEGSSIAELFKKKREIYFRKREAAVLFELLSDSENNVLATGGGTPCYGTVMDQLLIQSQSKTIYLKYDVDTLSRRLFDEREHRPLISHLQSEAELNEFVRKHLFERGFYYNRAEWVIDCTELSVEEIVEQIVLKLF